MTDTSGMLRTPQQLELRDKMAAAIARECWSDKNQQYEMANTHWIVDCLRKHVPEFNVIFWEQADDETEREAQEEEIGKRLDRIESILTRMRGDINLANHLSGLALGRAGVIPPEEGR